MEFIGIGHPKWIDDTKEKSRSIAAILVDTKFLITNYLHHNDFVTEKLIDIIETKLNSKDIEAMKARIDE